MHRIKNAIRKKFLELPVPLGEDEKIIGRTKELLMSLISKSSKCLIGIYFPTKREISTLSLMNWLSDMGIPYALPRITSYEDKEMVFFLYRQGEKIRRNKFGIFEPEQSKEVKPNIIVVPLVAADAQGQRLGHGHGYYDKYLSSAGASLVSIGLCYESHMHQGILPAEPHDQSLDYVITENKIYKFTS